MQALRSAVEFPSATGGSTPWGHGSGASSSRVLGREFGPSPSPLPGGEGDPLRFLRPPSGARAGVGIPVCPDRRLRLPTTHTPGCRSRMNDIVPIPDHHSRQKALRLSTQGFKKYSRQRPTLPPRRQGSTISAGGLNDRIRKGNGCGPSAMAAGNPLHDNCKETAVVLTLAKPHGLLVPLG